MPFACRLPRIILRVRGTVCDGCFWTGDSLLKGGLNYLNFVETRGSRFEVAPAPSQLCAAAAAGMRHEHRGPLLLHSWVARAASSGV